MLTHWHNFLYSKLVAKDRKGRRLSYDDIKHYQKIIVALHETDRIMQKINKLLPVE